MAWCRTGEGEMKFQGKVAPRTNWYNPSNDNNNELLENESELDELKLEELEKKCPSEAFQVKGWKYGKPPLSIMKRLARVFHERFECMHVYN